MRQFETHALDKMAYQATLFWWYKINVHRSYLKGWRIPPSHYTTQHLDQVWLDR